MLLIENTETYGWEAAIRGMRNPLNSWAKSDTQFFPGAVPVIGPNDLNLMKQLGTAGNDHGKFLRMIGASVDVTGPMYWWAEADTYKVGTVRNSCSKMHKLTAKEFTSDDFSWDQLLNTGMDLFTAESDNGLCCCNVQPIQFLNDYIIPALNECRNKYLETQDKAYWWQIIQLLPASYNQRSTLTLNYAVLKNIYHARKNHKLDCWHTFCEWIESLPYSELITGE